MFVKSYDGCKNCGCISFECKRCHFREFYRHIDDKLRFKHNCKTIRERGLVGNIIQIIKLKKL